ncbi:diguanylate cyclase domain-containing protein [Photobacterium nomapromontoriensis]|uniref:diguanylate cyclase domain-containing protein n=1 Tax=Photobacterium nomapromontoriensis TaxID=2910237 RepID=UPI003D0B2FEF
MSKWIEKLSLNQRLSIPIMSFILLVFLGFQLISYQNYLAIERDNLLTRTEILATGVGMNLVAPVLFNDAISAQDILTTLKADTLIVKARLELPDHQGFAEYTNSAFNYIHPTPKQQQQIIENCHLFGAEMLYIIVPVMLNDENIAHIHIAVSLQALQDIRINHLKISLFLLLLLSGTSVYIINRLQLWIVNPITQLKRGMRRIIIGDKHQPIPQGKYANDELYELTRGFNTMAETISQRDNELRQAMNELGEEKAFADEVIETVQHALIVVDTNGIVTLTNKSCYPVFSQPINNLMGKFLIDIIAPVDRYAFQQILNNVLAKGDELNHLLIDGNQYTGGVRTYQIVSRPLRHRTQTLFAVEDVTERHQAERQQKMAAKVFDNSQDSILLLELDGQITMVNSTFQRLTGYNEREILGKHFLQFIDPVEFEYIREDIDSALDIDNQWHGEIHTYSIDGEQLPLFVRINQINNMHNQEQQTVVIASDLRSSKEMKRLEHLANHDPLTNLANRVKLHQALQTALTQQKTTHEIFAVLFIDLDGFKDVNDNYGHDIGDQVLKIIAEKLRRTVRNSDMVSRLAGDEFVILLSTVKQYITVQQTCQRLFQRICEPMKINDKTLSVSASIGCYYVNAKDEQDIDDILRRADKAMYEAKLLGKGQIIEYNRKDEEQPK